MPVTLKNVSRRMHSYNLAAGFFEEDGGAHKYKLIHVTVVDHNGQTGSLIPRRIPKNVCSSLHFASGEMHSELPDEVLDCPDIAGALARRELVVLAKTEPPTKEAASSPEPRTDRSTIRPPAQKAKGT